MSNLYYEPKISLGNIITIGLLIAGGVAGYTRLEIRVSAQEIVANSHSPVIQQLRDTTATLGVRVAEVERKADGIASIGRELSEIRGELKGIAETLRRGSSDRAGRLNVPAPQ